MNTLRVNIIKNDDAQPNPITTVVFPGFDMVDTTVTILLHGSFHLFMNGVSS
jgi:hypothetical protein